MAGSLALGRGRRIDVDLADDGAAVRIDHDVPERAEGHHVRAGWRDRHRGARGVLGLAVAPHFVDERRIGRPEVRRQVRGADRRVDEVPEIAVDGEDEADLRVARDRGGAGDLQPVLDRLRSAADLQVLHPVGVGRQPHHQQDAEHDDRDHQLDQVEAALGQHVPPFERTQHAAFAVQPAGTAVVARAPAWVIVKVKPVALPELPAACTV